MVCSKDCGLQYSEIRAMMPGSGQVTSLRSSQIFMGESPLVMLARPIIANPMFQQQDAQTPSWNSYRDQG